MTYKHADRDALIARIQELEDWLKGDAFCTCCWAERECEEDCTLATDQPEKAERMEHVRHLLYGAGK